ncbi:MAG TPA: sulfotransferase domain-containing protein [Candidatus Sulfotelmatobacter sp.]|nr:sulfotransferase domain-containing protein [Candidatus Sulfotelmatobacter sp.]
MSLSLPSSAADPDSWACVTAYKAASSYVGALLGTLLRARGVPQIDLAGEAYKQGVDEATFCIENQDLVGTPGYYFGPFRDSYIKDMPSLRNARVVLHVRDPRDCLVSHHYSVAYSHEIPPTGPIRDDLMHRRQVYLNQGVDQSSLTDCGDFHRIFAALRDLARSHGGLYVSRYEDMVADFGGWLDRLCSFVRCDRLDAVKEALKHQTSFAVRENPLNHMRQVTPGDYRRKLTQQTQRALTEQLSDVLEYFGYSRE